MFRDSGLALGVRAEEVHVAAGAYGSPARGGIEELGQTQGGIGGSVYIPVWEPVAAASPQ